MVGVWFMDTSGAKDQREDHKYSPNREVAVEDLYKKTGVEYFYMDLDDTGKEDGGESKLELLRKKRGYTYEDVIDIKKDTLPNYEEKLKNFFEEHMHSDEEIRYCVAGSGYFDVRDDEDQWIRILITPGDLIILPAGIYHRFTLDTKNYIKAKRYFVGEPVWTPHNRPQEDHPARKDYLKLKSIFAEGMQQQVQSVKG